ncbi:hypothetical protein VPH35_041492 [Triticum aestivum]
METEVPFLSGVDEDGLPLAGVSDFRGRPVYRNTSGGWRAALFVVVMELASTFANYGVSANLITYLTGPLGHSNASAAAAVNIWSGTASLMPLLGAFVADSWLGCYRSIILASTHYALGYGMITLASTNPTQQASSLDNDHASHPSSVKVGADKPCGLAFAADQFNPGHPQECAARCSFFNWCYIQENLGWGIGFGYLCVIMISAALVVFLLGSPSYRLYAPTPGSQSPFTRLAHNIATLVRSSSCSFGTIIRGVCSVLRLLPIWTACLAYGVVFAQIMTFFNKQGRTLDRHLFASLELPPAALQTFGPAAILLFVSIYDRLLVPALRCMTGNPSGLTPLQRVGARMVVSLATVCVAALVEARRLEKAHEYGLVDDAGATVPMSWVWLVPQYVMIGVADVFAMVGMQEFFYDHMPIELCSLGLALYFSVMGIGGFISGALISLIDRVTSSGGGDSWFADNLNRAHLDYFYWLLAGLSAIELVLYIRVTISFVYRRKSLH